MANITINLDGNAEEGMAALEEEIGKTVSSVDELTTSTAKLAEVQKQEITVVHHHRDSLVEIGKFTLEAAAKVTALASSFVWLHAKQSAVAGFQTTLATAMESVTTAVTTQTGRWKLLQDTAETAGGTAIKAIVGIGPQVVGATVALKGYEALLARTGERWDEFGQKTTNLDRARTAVNSLAGEIRDNLATGFREIPAYYARLTSIDRAWQEIDKSVTRANDNFIENVGHVRSLAQWMGLVASSTKEFDDRVRRTADDFERLREISEKWGDADDAKRRSKSADEYAKKIGELGVHINANLQIETNASHTALTAAVTRIDAEIAKRKEAAGQLAAANKLTAEEAKKYEEEVSALRELRAEHSAKLDQYEKDAQRTNLRLFVESEREKERLYRQMSEERIERNEAEYKRLRNLRLEEEDFEYQLELENERSRQIMREQAAADKQKKLAADEQARVAAAQREVDLEQQKQAALKNARQQALEKAGVNGQDLLQMARPQDVLNTLRQQAGEKARQQAAADNQDLLRKGQFDSNGPERRQYEMALQRAQQDAMRQATRDFQRGTTDPQAMAQAQAQAAQKQLGALQQQGKLSADSVQAMSELIQATAEQQATTQALQRQMAEYGRAAAALRGQAQQQRRQAQAGSLQ